MFSGYQPESDWDRAQSESIMITADDLLTTIGREVYIYIIYKVRATPSPPDPLLLTFMTLCSPTPLSLVEKHNFNLLCPINI